MNLKRSQFAIQNKNSTDLENEKDFPTIADLMREQNISSDKEKQIIASDLCKELTLN